MPNTLCFLGARSTRGDERDVVPLFIVLCLEGGKDNKLSSKEQDGLKMTMGSHSGFPGRENTGLLLPVGVSVPSSYWPGDPVFPGTAIVSLQGGWHS